MSRTISSTVHPIQRCMASAHPAAWSDGLVTHVDGAEATIALLNGESVRVRIVGPAVDLVAGEPVAYHPVAELLSATAALTTARRA
ncbi:MAG: nuclease [Microbacterium sp.]|uniref:nuclease n=1 Tax=unclassified Microbacterium TaxID=2609290 RepID=UPI000A75FAFB|nr:MULTISPECIES: nuclease [unclassified Microbacterium]MBN9210489.1 nuclease [Microbacterium sp.]